MRSRQGLRRSREGRGVPAEDGEDEASFRREIIRRRELRIGVEDFDAIRRVQCLPCLLGFRD